MNPCAPGEPPPTPQPHSGYIVYGVSGPRSGRHKPFYDQPDPTKEYFVQPKALALISHRGGEYIMWKKRDGSLSATRVSRFDNANLS